jgi:ketosteroid isomerase-like protein
MGQSSESVLGAVEAYKACVRRKDVAAFIGLYADNVRVCDTWVTWSHDGAAAWQHVVEQWFGSLGTDHVRVDFADVECTEDGAMATLSAFVKYTAVSAAGIELRSMHNRLTWALQRDGAGGWKIFHEHTSVPIGSADLRGILQRGG